MIKTENEVTDPTPEQMAFARAADNAVSTVLTSLMAEEGADPRFIGGGVAMAFARFVAMELVEKDKATVADVNKVAFRAINYAATALLVVPHEVLRKGLDG